MGNSDGRTAPRASGLLSRWSAAGSSRAADRESWRGVFFLYLALVAAGVTGFLYAVMGLRDLFGNAWYIRPFPLLGFWGILLIPQWYVVVLTVNYFDQRLRKGESPLATLAQPQT
jgi:hypothetical protein